MKSSLATESTVANGQIGVLIALLVFVACRLDSKIIKEYSMTVLLMMSVFFAAEIEYIFKKQRNTRMKLKI